MCPAVYELHLFIFFETTMATFFIYTLLLSIIYKINSPISGKKMKYFWFPLCESNNLYILQNALQRLPKSYLSECPTSMLS